MFHVPHDKRMTSGYLASRDSAGNNGAFEFNSGDLSHRKLFAIASDGGGWEHVSVQASEGGKSRIPTWTEMCAVKDTFWGPEDVVMQLHPARSEYVNNHPNVLHLWRPTEGTIPTPPAVFVGIPNTARS